jgi:hypothetical protein
MGNLIQNLIYFSVLLLLAIFGVSMIVYGIQCMIEDSRKK